MKKLTLLFFVFVLGILIGFTITHNPDVTGAAVVCSANNEPCECDSEICSCGDITVPAEYCRKSLKG